MKLLRLFAPKVPPSPPAAEPLGLQQYRLQAEYDALCDKDFDLAQKKYRARLRRIEDIIVTRNQRGITAEKNGDLAGAIKQYEANIADLVDTPHPYQRLRIIYTRQKRYADAVRVCEQAITTAQTLAANFPATRTWTAGFSQEYATWCAKLKAKL